LLNDDSLMQQENLLLNPDDIFAIPPRVTKVGDINTGTVFRNAYNLYAKGKNNIILCPIIFFIDKTFTDTNGRLNLEQIRFTLGIFKREVRNRPQAWRTLGYITDQARLKTDVTWQKSMDYHFMADIILQSFKEAQKDAIGWKLQLNNSTKLVYFRCPVLFIVGDTDGHDKLCGKYSNRTHANRLCRACNIPKEETDNVRFNFRYTKQIEIQRLMHLEREEELKEMSYYCIKNAWHDVLFCDQSRGIHGACPGEIMHCLQHGLYLYCIKGLFSQKAVKKISGKKRKANDPHRRVEVPLEQYSLEDAALMNPTHELSSFSVFTDSYCKRFDFVTRQYGKLLQRQSDRNLPRTFFNTDYTTIARKNAAEVTGLLVVYLIVFASQEGQDVLDTKFKEDRSSQWLHLFEMLLLLENFLKADEHLKSDVEVLAGFMPALLNTFKALLVRKEGMGMKLIKFHLPMHFSDDIIRFGCMQNFDTGIGESHHKTEAKKPAKRTQRRFVSFEKQVADRQIENLAISMAKCHLYQITVVQREDEFEKKGFNIQYRHEKNQLIYRSNKKKWHLCHWPDSTLQKRLTNICHDLCNAGSLLSPVNFFTFIKTQTVIYRACPKFSDGNVWYDWAYVSWLDDSNVESLVPAKLLLYISITQHSFIKSFKFGDIDIIEPGDYAIGYSFPYGPQVMAHTGSVTCLYGELETELVNNIGITPKICIFPIHSIVKPCIAVPFNCDPSVDCINAHKWLLMRSRAEWYDLFVDFMKEHQYESGDSDDDSESTSDTN